MPDILFRNPAFFFRQDKLLQRSVAVLGQDIKSNTMKSLGIWVTVVIASLAMHGCKKNACSPATTSGSLYGRWQYAAHYYGIGPPGEWHPVTVPGLWIELRRDGSFSSNVIPYLAAHSYQLIDSIHIKMIIHAGSDSLLYRFSKRGDTLDLSPYAPLCVEGCADRFLK